MLLAVLITIGSIGLLICVGWLADRLLGGSVDQWARGVADAHDAGSGPRTRRPQVADRHQDQLEGPVRDQPAEPGTNQVHEPVSDQQQEPSTSESAEPVADPEREQVAVGGCSAAPEISRAG